MKKFVLAFVVSLLLTFAPISAFLAMHSSPAAALPLPISVDPNSVEELKNAIVQYPANLQVLSSTLKTAEFITKGLKSTVKDVKVSLTTYGKRTFFTDDVLPYISPDRQIYQLSVVIPEGAPTEGGRCLRDAIANHLFDAETGKILTSEIRCPVKNFQYSHPLRFTPNVVNHD